MKQTPRSSILVLPVALLAGSAAFLAACASGGAPQTTVDSRPAGNPDYRLVVLDPQFGEDVLVANVARRRVEGFLQVQVTLQSRAGKTLPLETKWEWYDSDGFKIDDGREVWSPADLPAGTVLDVKGIAPKPEAGSFKFHVRLAAPLLDNR